MDRIYVKRSKLIWQSDRSCPLGAISLSGYLRNSRGIPLNRLRNYGSFALVYLLEGSGRMKVGAQPSIKCRAGDMLFVYPGVLHAYGPGPGEKWSEMYIVFNGPVFELWRRSGLLDPARALQRLAPISRWLPQLQAIADPSRLSTVEGMLQGICLLQKFLAEIIPPPESKTEGLPWLEQAMDELVNRPDLSAPSLARQLGLSYETFRKEFSRQAGCPPARYRQQRLIEQAKVLIRERRLSNKQLAETLGFYDEFHFSRRFRELAGKSPREFRYDLASSTL